METTRGKFLVDSLLRCCWSRGSLPSAFVELAPSWCRWCQSYRRREQLRLPRAPLKRCRPAHGKHQRSQHLQHCSGGRVLPGAGTVVCRVQQRHIQRQRQRQRHNRVFEGRQVAKVSGRKLAVVDIRRQLEVRIRYSTMFRSSKNGPWINLRSVLLLASHL